jgi:hypothetical protein
MTFPPIYIIKMPGSERNPELFESLKKLGLSYEIQTAIIGKNLTSGEINSQVNLRSCKARLGYDISQNLIGCALSHKEIYRKAYFQNKDWILVFEEDAKLTDFDPEQIIQITGTSSAEPLIIQLFSRSARLMNKKTIELLPGGTREIFTFQPRLVGSGASAYLMNKSALKLSQKNHLLGGPPDWPEWSSKVTMKGVYPWMTTESDIGSTIPIVRTKRIKYLLRRFMQVTFIHFLVYKNEYENILNYISEELHPLFLHLIWKLRGSRFYKNDVNGPQVIG